MDPPRGVPHLGLLLRGVASSSDKEISASLGLRQQLAELEKIQDQQQTKLQGELLHLHGRSRFLQDEIANRGLSIAGLEQKLAAIFIHPTKIVRKKAHKEDLLGVEPL